jgi:hypothetical protein
MTDQLLTVTQFAKLYPVSRAAIHAVIRASRLPASRAGPIYLIPQDAAYEPVRDDAAKGRRSGEARRPAPIRIHRGHPDAVWSREATIHLIRANLPAAGYTCGLPISRRSRKAQRLWLETKAAFDATGVSPVAAAVALRRCRVSRSFRWDQRGRVLPAEPIRRRVLVRTAGDQGGALELVDRDEPLISQVGSCCWLNPGDREARNGGCRLADTRGETPDHQEAAAVPTAAIAIWRARRTGLSCHTECSRREAATPRGATTEPESLIRAITPADTGGRTRGAVGLPRRHERTRRRPVRGTRKRTRDRSVGRQLEVTAWRRASADGRQTGRCYGSRRHLPRASPAPPPKEGEGCMGNSRRRDPSAGGRLPPPPAPPSESPPRRLSVIRSAWRTWSVHRVNHPASTTHGEY